MKYIFIFIFLIHSLKVFSVKNIDQLEGKYYVNGQKMCIVKTLVFKDYNPNVISKKIQEKMSDQVSCQAFVVPLNVGNLFTSVYIESGKTYLMKTAKDLIFEDLKNIKLGIKDSNLILVDVSSDISDKSEFYNEALVVLFTLGKTPKESQFLLSRKIKEEGIEKISKNLLNSISER